MSNKPIHDAVANGKIHPQFRRKNLEVIELCNLYNQEEKFWAIVQRNDRNKLQPLGTETGMFRYDSQEEAQDELDILNLWQAEGAGSA